MKTRFITLFVFFTMTFQSIFAQVWEKQIPTFATPTQIWEVYTPNDTVGWAWGFAFDANGDYTYEDYQLLRTTDGGQTWQSVNFPHAEPGWFSNISARGDQVAWVAYVDYANGQKILKTTDGGQTWTDQPNGLTAWINFVHFFDNGTGLAAGDPNDVGFEIYTSANGGAYWEQVDPADIPPPLPGEFGFSGYFETAGNQVWFETNKGRVYYSMNKGYTWDVFEGPLGQVAYSMFAADDTGMCYMTYNTSDPGGANPVLDMYRSPDNGTTWENITPEDNGWWIGDIEPIPGTGAIMGAFFSGGPEGIPETRLSYDQGITWQTIDTGNDLLFVDFYDDHTGFASGWRGNQDTLSGPIYRYIGSPLTGLFNREPLNVSLTIFPNPASDFAQIQISSPATAEFWLLLNDANGRLLHKEVIGKTDHWSTSLDLRDLPAGIYTVTVSSGEGMLVQKIVKQ